MQFYMTLGFFAPILGSAAATFNLYPSMNETKLSSAFNITTDCMRALYVNAIPRTIYIY